MTLFIFAVVLFVLVLAFLLSYRMRAIQWKTRIKSNQNAKITKHLFPDAGDGYKMQGLLRFVNP